MRGRCLFVAVGVAAAGAGAPACHDQGLGDPCVPDQETRADFAGFSEDEVNVETRSMECVSRLCLVNHYRGRVTPGGPPTTPAPCSHRPARDAVYCSCRCANVDGRTDDGFPYCACPDGFTCTQLVSSIGQDVERGLTGAYCIPNGTAYEPTDCP